MGKRLIDANALIAEYDRVHIGPAGGARKLMEEAPTVDAVEVVRCEKCENAILRQEDDFDGMPPYYCPFVSDYVRGDGFCSHGKRRSDLTNLLFADMEEIIDATD